MNVSNEHLLLINILNTMYNDNNRQIQSLTQQNNQIINIITDILHFPNSSNNRQQNNNQQTNRQQNNRQQTNRPQNNSGTTFLNNRQYIIDDVQSFDLPSNANISRTGMGIGRTVGNYINTQARNAARNVARDAARDVVRDVSGNIVHPQQQQQSERINNAFTSLFQNFFDPILVYPTISQIENATRRVLYRDIVAPINSSCPISMDNFSDNDTVTIIRHCGHIFNNDELNTWFQSNCRCPVCRYDIRNFNNTSSRNNPERNNITNVLHNATNNILYPEDVSGNYVQW
jgi:hypothetical protein